MKTRRGAIGGNSRRLVGTRTGRRGVSAPPAANAEASGPSLVRIFTGTLSALSRRGAKQLSMTDVCGAAGISRATLYRYFSKKEDLLAALAGYVTSNFVAGVQAAADQEAEIPMKLRAVLQFMISYTRQINSDRILEVEPEFVLRSLHAQFPRHLTAVRTALEPVFDEFEARSGVPVDRALFSELLLRAQESTSLIPGGPSWNAMPDVLARFVEQYLGAFSARRIRQPVLRSTRARVAL